MTDRTNDEGKSIHRHGSTGTERDARSVAAAVMPTVQDVLASGMDDQFLKDILQGRASSHFGKSEFLHLLGLKRNRAWDYEHVSSGGGGAGGESGSGAAAGAGVPGPPQRARGRRRGGRRRGAAVGAVAGAGAPGAGATNKLIRPSEYDFNWAILRTFMTNRAHVDASRSLWTNFAHVVRNESTNARGKLFSLAARLNMPIEVMRDVFFQMQIEMPEYQVRVPLFNHQRAALLDDRGMQHSGGKKILEGANPAEVHPHGMFKALGVLQKDFETPKRVQRLFEDPIAVDSGYQWRLDHLNGSLALPTAATPVSFGRGSYIKEARTFNGVYVNKWVAREHANLVVEASAFLSSVPGVAGGAIKHAPESFRESPMLAFRRGARATARADADAARVRPVGWRGGSAARPAATRVRIPGAATDAAPRRAQPGAARVSTAASAEDDARVPTMVYDWDMLQTFFTYKMAHTLHNDVENYVSDMRRNFPEAFQGEDLSQTLRDLPQVCLRFPGLRDTESLLQPLSVKLSLTQPKGRFVSLDKAPVSDGDGQSSVLAKATMHSITNGRQMEHDDPAVRAFEAEQRGEGGGRTLRGNLFSRSAWQHFTLAQLDRRGMLSEAEAERVRDQGLFLRQRVAHAESVRGESLRTVLNQTSPLSCGTFEARERIMRETGRDPTIWHARVPRSRQNEDQDELEALGVAKSFTKPTIGAVRVGARR